MLRKWGRALVLMAVGVAHGADLDPASDPNARPNSPTGLNGYRLVWSDEFNGSTLDESKWIYRQGDDSRTFVKSFQTPANNSVSGGLYRCHLKKESMGTKAFTAGGIISAKKMRYGYYEARFNCPPTGGWHTSFWMMSRNGGTPSVELDVFENDSIDLFDYSVNVHRWKPDPHVAFGTKKVATPSLHADFHVLGCEYTPTAVRYFFNGALVQEVDATQFDHNDMNVWLTSLGLVYDWQPAIDESQLPVEAQYDYVRFFELGPHATVEIMSPDHNGATLSDTNTWVELSATVAAVNTNAVPVVHWSRRSGPGTVTFSDANAENTGARFAGDGTYELVCDAIIGAVTNSDAVVVSVNAPVSLSLQHGTGDYDNPCTFIRGDLPARNSGADVEMIIGRWGNQGLRGLLSFDLRSLDADAEIQEVELSLYNYAGSGSVGALQLQELSVPFVEGSGDGNSDASGAGSGATWYARTGSENWSAAGGDFLPPVLSSMPGYAASAAGVKVFGSSPDFAAAAQGALDAGLALNLMISSPATESGGANAISRLSSDDAGSADQRPRLTIRYLGNHLPAIRAGEDRIEWMSDAVALEGAADHASTVEWSKLYGPGAVVFSDAAALTNSATFSLPGSYLLRLRGENARGAGYQDVAVSVLDQPPTFTAATLSNDLFVVEFNSATGLAYTLYSSTNLLGDWTELYTTNMDSSPMRLEMPVSTNGAAFYQMILHP